MFGERGIMIESKRTGTVITTSPLHVAVLTKAEYKALLEDNELGKSPTMSRQDQEEDEAPKQDVSEESFIQGDYRKAVFVRKA